MHSIVNEPSFKQVITNRIDSWVFNGQLYTDLIYIVTQPVVILIVGKMDDNGFVATGSDIGRDAACVFLFQNADGFFVGLILLYVSLGDTVGIDAIDDVEIIDGEGVVGFVVGSLECARAPQLPAEIVISSVVFHVEAATSHSHHESQPTSNIP